MEMHSGAKAVIAVLVPTGLGAILGGPVWGSVMLGIGALVLLAFGFSPVRRWLGLPGGRASNDPPQRTGVKLKGGSAKGSGWRISGQDTAIQAEDTEIDLENPEID